MCRVDPVLMETTRPSSCLAAPLALLSCYLFEKQEEDFTTFYKCKETEDRKVIVNEYLYYWYYNGYLIQAAKNETTTGPTSHMSSIRASDVDITRNDQIDESLTIIGRIYCTWSWYDVLTSNIHQQQLQVYSNDTSSYLLLWNTNDSSEGVFVAIYEIDKEDTVDEPNIGIEARTSTDQPRKLMVDFQDIITTSDFAQQIPVVYSVENGEVTKIIGSFIRLFIDDMKEEDHC